MSVLVQKSYALFVPVLVDINNSVSPVEIVQRGVEVKSKIDPCVLVIFSLGSKRNDLENRHDIVSLRGKIVLVTERKNGGTCDTYSRQCRQTSASNYQQRT